MSAIINGIEVLTPSDLKKISQILPQVTATDNMLLVVEQTNGTGANTSVGSIRATLIPATQKGLANGVATLGADGKIPASQLPALAVVDVYPVGSQAAMLACAAEQGDIAVRTDSNQVFILSASPASTLANWVELSALKALVDAAIADLAGAGRTTETVKGLADDIAELETQIASLETHDQTHDEQFVRISKEVQDTKDAMASNSNAPKLVTEGIGSVSLPSNAGGVAKVGVKGVSVTNKMDNGDFSLPISGIYFAEGGATVTENGDGTVRIQNTMEYRGMLSVADKTSVGTVYAFICRIKSDSPSVQVGSNVSEYALITGVTTSWNTYIVKFTSVSEMSFKVGLKAITANKYIDLDWFMLIDLTQAGLTSYNADQLAQMLSYFDGTRHFSGVGCVRTVGKNICPPITWRQGDWNNTTAGNRVSTNDRNIMLRKGVTYSFSGNNATLGSSFALLANPTDTLLTGAIGWFDSHTYTPTQDLWVVPVIRKSDDSVFTPSELDGFILQIEISATPTPVTPYEEHDFFFLGSEERRLPNSTHDTQVGDVQTKKVNKYVLQESDVLTLSALTNIQYINLNKPIDSIFYNVSDIGGIVTQMYIKDYTGQRVINDIPADVFKFSSSGLTTFGISVPAGTFADLASAKATVAGTVICYELATPIISTIPTSGTPLAKPNGQATYYPWIQDVGIYDGGLTIATPATEIVALEVYDSPYEPPTVVTDGVIANGGLSVTSASIANGKVVRIVYAFEEPINPPMSLEYFNDVLTVEDNVTGKRYTYKPTVASGAITGWTLVEV